MKRLSILLFFIALMMPPCHEPGTSMAQQCSEDQLARLTMPMVGGSVPAESAFTPVWVYSNDHTPASGDSQNTESGGYTMGALIAAPTGATKITKLSVWVNNDDTARTIRICVWSSDGNTLVGGGQSVTPATETGFYALEVSGLDLAVTAGNTYFVAFSPATTASIYCNTDGSNDRYTEDDYSAGGCVSNLGTLDPGNDYTWDIAAYFE